MASSSRRVSCYQVKITKVEKFSRFVKITAQNINDPDYIQLSNGLIDVYNSSETLRDEELELGELFIAKINELHERCRLLDSDDFSSIALVDFIDLGHHGRVKYSDLRAFTDESLQLKALPSISKEFILANLLIQQQQDESSINRLTSLISNKFATMTILGQSDVGKFVDLQFAQSSLVQDIVLKHPILNTMFKHIPFENQLKMKIDSEDCCSQAPKRKTQSTKKTPKSCDNALPAQFLQAEDCNVRISYCARGPNEFYVQFEDSLQDCQNLNIKLRSKKKFFKHVTNPQLNEMYVAVYDNESIDRVMVLENIHQSAMYVVRLVDDGVKRLMNSSQICELPDDLKVAPFAWKFALFGIESDKLPVEPNELNFYFSYLTNGKKLRLQVNKKAEKKGELNLCSLYEGQMNILSLIKKFKPNKLKYPPQKQLNIRSVLKAKISSFESPNLFYINIPNNNDIPPFFNDLEVFRSCNFEKPEKDNACCVFVKGKYYRGKVLKTISPLIITCQLVDSGLIDDFSSNEIRLTVEKFAKYPPLAYKCTLFGLDQSKLNRDSTKIFKEICTRNQLFVVVIKQFKDDVYHVTLETADKKNVLDEIMKSSFINYLAEPPVRRIAVRKQRSDSFRINPPNRMTEPLILNSLDWTPEDEVWNTLGDSRDINEDDIAIITSVVSPTDFIIQLKNTIPAMKAFLSHLQSLGENGDPLTIFEKSEMCLVKNPYTKEWCRAMIINSTFNENSSKIDLKNVDDGSCYTLDNPSELKKYPFQCVTTPYFGIRCALPVKVSKRNSFEAIEVMMHLIDQEIKYTILCANEIVNVIDLKPIKGKNVISELVRADLAVGLEYIVSGMGKIVHVENLSEFYVALDSEEGSLETVQTHADAYEEIPFERDMRLDDVIMAKSEINKCWARAKIIKLMQSTDELEVKFLDFGHCEKVSINDTGAVAPQYEQINPLAHCCSLFMPKGVNPKSINAVARLKKLASGESFYFKMMIPTKTKAVVQILKFHNNVFESGEPKNMGIEIIGLCDVIERPTESDDVSPILEDDLN